MSKNIYTVSEVNHYLKSKLEQDQTLINISLQGEISNITNHSSGHIYFTMKDQSAQIRAVMFSFRAKNFQFKLKEGLKIIAIGSVKLYEPQGTYSLQVSQILLAGVGDLFLKYEALKKSLQAKGWFDESLKKQIPRFPKNIGIISAPTGAAIHDIITTIHRRFPQTNTYLFPSLVQGQEAKFDLQAKILAASNFIPKIDTLIVARGGGSIEDLWAFNELEVVQAIYQCAIPVIAAIGHEIDFTLTDFVADLRAPTPTAGAELATPDQQQLKNFVNQQKKSLIMLIKQQINQKAQNLFQLQQAYVWSNPQLIYHQKEMKYQLFLNKFESLKDTFFYKLKTTINKYQATLILSIEQYLNDLNAQKINLIAKLDLLSPLKTLTRGYSITYDDVGQVVTSIATLQPGATLTARVNDGLIYANIIAIEKVGS